MRRMNGAVNGVFIAALLGASMSALAASDPNVDPTVTPVPDAVSLSRPAGGPKDPALQTYAGYKVLIPNGTTNNLNRIHFSGIASNVGGTDMVYWDSTTLPNSATQCTGFGTPILNCQTDISVPPGGSYEFYVVARAPKDGLKIQIDWEAGGFEGNGGNNGCCATPGTAETMLRDPTTDPTYLSFVKSYVKQTGTTTIFTGDRFITRPGDPISTSVTVPGLSGGVDHDVGTVSEATLGSCPIGATLASCYESTISVPTVDFSNGGTVTPTSFITITLRLDSSAFPAKTKVEDLQLTYDGAPVNTLCGTSSPEVYPCIIDRRILKPGDVDYNKDLKGDAQWKLRHYKNGTWRIL